jgi:hypothetical protein
MKNVKCNVLIFFATHNFKEIMGSAVSSREYCFVIIIYTIKYFNTTSCKYILKYVHTSHANVNPNIYIYIYI